LQKVYQDKIFCCKQPTERTIGVARASFGVAAGECFALLGVNGAGKSTCFKSLTKEVVASGEIKLKN